MRDMSRRSFVELFTGTLVSLPVLAGGLVLAPQVVHADPDDTDEDEAAGKHSDPVIIDVVEPWEVGFMVVDVTKPTVSEAGMVSYPPVPMADVTVTSRFNGQTAHGTTNSNGIVNIDIRGLCVVEEGEDVNKLDEYYFNGRIAVQREEKVVPPGITLPVYRKFETALVAIEGGTGFQVPAHPAEELGTPYPHLISFDEWDALYSKNEFLLTPKNDGEHVVSVSIFDLPGDDSTTFELWVEGEEKPRKSAEATLGERVKIGTRVIHHYMPGWVEPDTYEDVYARPAEASFKARFLKTGDADALPAGAKFKIVAKQGGVSYSWPLAFGVFAGVVDEPGDKEGQVCQPIEVRSGDGVKAQAAGLVAPGAVDLAALGAGGLVAQGKTGLDVKWPNDVPIIGGGDLLAWIPELPIGIYVNPFGLVQLSLSVPIWGYRNDKGNGDPHGWGNYPRMSVQQQWERKKKTFNTMKEKTEACVSKPGSCQQIDLFKNISVDINFQFMALAEWNSGKGSFGGELAGQILTAVNFTITENFFAGPLPVLITFAADASLTFGLTAALSVTRRSEQQSLTDAIFDFSNWGWDYTKGGFTMTLSITPSLSVGIGVRGIASISVKGAITLTLFLGVPMGAQPSYLPSPHFTAGWSAQVAIVIELFLFTETFPLYTKKFENFYDNWDGRKPAALADDAQKGNLADKQLGDLLAGLRPITNAMLATTNEASVSGGTAKTEAEYAGWDAMIDWEAARTEAKGQLEDGTSLGYIVYTFGEPDPAGGQSGLDAQGGEGVAEMGSASRVDSALVAQEEPDVTWLATMADVELPAAGVASLGAAGGIRPSSDVRLFGTDDRHVFGTGHAKVVKADYPNGFDSKPFNWCFRIASVEVGGQMRTRVIATCIDSEYKGTTRIIEFNTGFADLPHDALYDYDFDVIPAYEEQPRAYFCFQLVIVSGRRKQEGTTFAEAATDLVFSCVYFETEDLMFGSGVARSTYSCCRRGNEVLDHNKNWCHSISSVKIATGDQDMSSLVTFLDRSASEREAILGQEATVSVGLLFIKWYPSISVIIPRQDELQKIVGAFGDVTVYEQVLSEYASEGNVRSYALMLRGSKMAHYVLLTINFDEAYQGNPVNAVKSIRRCKDYDAAIRLIACPAQGYFLASYPTDPSELDLPTDKHDYRKWKLHAITWSDDAVPTMQVRPIGNAGFNVVNFAVNPKGTFIFWPHTRDADEDRVFHADGKADTREGAAVYQIMACRIRGEHFSDPFVVADLPTDTDMLSVVDTNAGAVVEMLRSSYVDTGERNEKGLPLYHAADIWYTAVPAVRCVTATACEAPDPFVSPGGLIAFNVAVRNDGNTFLSGCSLTLCDQGEDGSFKRVDGATVQLVFGKDTIRESTYNRDDGKGGLTNLEPDYALGPGKTSVYQVNVRVPKDWKSGERKVLFVASDGVVASELTAQGGLWAMAEAMDSEAVEFHIEPGDYKVVQQRSQVEADAERRHMETLVVSPTAADGAFEAAPTTILGEGVTPGTTPRVTPGTSAQAGREVLPSTGDGRSGAGLGVLGLGLAAAGAAAAAYERRRAENEG